MEAAPRKGSAPQKLLDLQEALGHEVSLAVKDVARGCEMIRFRAALASVAVLAFPARVLAAEDPVAVMPFKNLNADPALDWLKIGVAETIISDLRKGGAVKVVERAQLDRALAEVALQDQKGSEESAAARVGRMVGARTIVLGSFQKAGEQLRIVARTVSVESGVVQETAKVTGSMEDIFSLQDEIVIRLLGRVPEAAKPLPARPPRPKVTQKTVQAYRLYAMSLTTASDADRVGLLQDAVAADPAFTYAVDDLAALRGRLVAYRRAIDRTRHDKDAQLQAELRAAMLAPGTSDTERAEKALKLMEADLKAQRYRALIEDATLVIEEKIPSSDNADPQETASYSIFRALMELKQIDLALQAGERYLKSCPEGENYRLVERQMESIIAEIEDADDLHREAEQQLETNERERQELAAEEKAGQPVSAIRVCAVDQGPCSINAQYKQHTQAVIECSRFAAKYAGASDPDIRDKVYEARELEARAHAEQGDFARARAILEELIAQDPLGTLDLKDLLSSWPRD